MMKLEIIPWGWGLIDEGRVCISPLSAPWTVF